jgi:hypothetical protein
VIAHQSTNTCHLGNIALKVGRKLAWDTETETETFKNDPEAMPCLLANRARDSKCPASESFCGVGATRRLILCIPDRSVGCNHPARSAEWGMRNQCIPFRIPNSEFRIRKRR